MNTITAVEGPVAPIPRRRRKALRILLAVAGVIAVLAGIAGAVAYAFVARFLPDPVIAEVPKAKDRAEAMRQDLTVLGRLLDYDRSFSREARLGFEAERARLIDAADTLTPQALEMQVSRLAALAGTGRTPLGKSMRRINHLPILLAGFARSLFAVLAD